MRTYSQETSFSLVRRTGIIRFPKAPRGFSFGQTPCRRIVLNCARTFPSQVSEKNLRRNGGKESILSRRSCPPAERGLLREALPHSRYPSLATYRPRTCDQAGGKEERKNIGGFSNLPCPLFPSLSFFFQSHLLESSALLQSSRPILSASIDSTNPPPSSPTLSRLLSFAANFPSTSIDNMARSSKSKKLVPVGKPVQRHMSCEGVSLSILSLSLSSKYGQQLTHR